MNFLNNALYFIFPPECEICGKVAKNYICNKCFEKLKNEKIYNPQIKNYEIDMQNVKHLYIFKYEGEIRNKILSYKFKDKPYLYKMFSEFFVKNEKICGFLKKYDIIIPVPMTRKKLAQRGYNQSELIAKEISKNIKTLIYEKNILIKVKNTALQSSLNRKKRLENVKNVYKVQNEQKIKEKNILLFDDIYTTGATCKECIKNLKESGAKEICILTIAKDFEKIK